MTPRRILDSHVHFIEASRFSYPWMREAPSLRRRFDPSDYREATLDLPVTDLVFIECTAEFGQSLDEVDWVLGLQSEEPRLKRIVARAPLTDRERRGPVLEALRTRPGVVGIRDIIQWEPRGYCSQPAYIEGVKLASELGFHLELCIFHPQLPDVLELVRACPGVRFVLNHCGKPGIAQGAMEPWASELRELSRFENVSCKISALLTEASAKWRPEDFPPYTDHVIECFGHERIMYGGDWPVVTLAGSYKDWFEVTRLITRGFSEEALDRYYYENARAFYGL
ncbi:MAG TPA: amidohydrolase family protein [Polyangiaceae bacterium]|nr:amidohydrolase family protein [Polyangiaceae bacterium]